jgi:hypothetical protein
MKDLGWVRGKRAAQHFAKLSIARSLWQAVPQWRIIKENGGLRGG